MNSAFDASQADLILCATHRLARHWTMAGEGHVRLARTAKTIAQWLDAEIEQQLLLGHISDAPRRLTTIEERVLWRQVIDDALRGNPLAGLLDRDGLVAAAVEAQMLVEVWGVAPGEHSDDAKQFAGWRRAFVRRCDSEGLRDEGRFVAWQVEALRASPWQPPRRIAFAGFDRFNPQEQVLRDLLRDRGVVLVDESPAPSAQASGLLAFDDPGDEAAAAIAWAKNRLAKSPNARIGIVIPDLAGRRADLLRRLDEAFLPQALLAEESAQPRPFNLSLGESLATVPIVAAALALLRLAGGRELAQTELGSLLCGPYWGGDQSERAERALLDADLRRHLPPTISWADLSRRAWRLHFQLAPADRQEPEVGGAEATSAAADESTPSGRSQGLRHSARALSALVALTDAWPSRQLPSHWAEAFVAALSALGWPGERPVGSHEFQAQEAFGAALDSLAGLDGLMGRVPATEALGLLGEICRDGVFQPRTEGVPQIQVMGLLEAAADRFDALWACGLSESAWPPPARPNPFLHAAAQRAAASPNASAEVQMQFAAAIHSRLLAAAPEVLLSWSRRDGDQERLPSPLLNLDDRAGGELVALEAANQFAREPPLAGVLRAAAESTIETIADSRGPPVADGEAVAGGTQLLRAQAICPAWAYYQFRIGARRLEMPVEGLDPRDRGTLVHSVLEAFWRDRSSAEVFSWDAATRAIRIRDAVDAGLSAFEARTDEALPARFRALESDRLGDLLSAWLAVEAQRAVSFTVLGCEVEQNLQLRALPIRVVADRVDRLEDGSAVIIDYKTGRAPAVSAWAEERISEPQLPIYAVFGALGTAVAAVAFAELRGRPPRLVGLARTDGLLPGVATVAASRAFASDRFPDWDALLAGWEQRLTAIADEVLAGEAALRFAQATQLQYADVLPVLRLAERDWLADMESADTGSANTESATEGAGDA